MVKSTKSILIVDDDANIRKLTRTAVETLSSYVVCGEARDGVEAIEKAQALQPDLVIMDLSMPRMNGLDAAKILRKMMRTLPIVLFTLHAQAITSAQATASGIDAVVSKIDITPGLIANVERLLSMAGVAANGRTH